jgi:DNA-binding CsgD family transcriptional regulator/pimeloyl-ACP methyl ester carboxylesterase
LWRLRAYNPGTMDAPPVQYARASDGYTIAFSVSGHGRPLIMIPWLFTDLMDQWRLPSHRLLFEELSQRFQVIRIDARGTGMSSRQIDEDFEVGHINRDIDAVADFLHLSSFALYGGAVAGQAAVLYAHDRPERVEALILWGVAVDKISALALIDEELGRSSWELFVQARQSFFAPLEEPADFVRAACNFVTPDGFFAAARRCNEFTLEPILPQVSTPALVLSRRGPDVGRTSEERARRVASLMPNSKCVELPGLASGLFTRDGSTPPAVLAMEEFLSQIPTFTQSSPGAFQTSVLSSREAEVLRLLAAGRSNQQIADELVISLNTVRRHVSNIFDKTGAANRAQATAYAKDHGIA